MHFHRCYIIFGTVFRLSRSDAPPQVMLWLPLARRVTWGALPILLALQYSQYEKLCLEAVKQLPVGAVLSDSLGLATQARDLGIGTGAACECSLESGTLAPTCSISGLQQSFALPSQLPLPAAACPSLRPRSLVVGQSPSLGETCLQLLPSSAMQSSGIFQTMQL